MGEWKPTQDKIRKIALKIAEAKGWKPKALSDEAFMALVDATVVMTVRALEMCGYRIADMWAPIDSAPKDGTVIIGAWLWGCRWSSRALFWDGQAWVDPHSDLEHDPTHWISPPPKD